MPLYEYRCNECGAEFEKMLRFSEADQLPTCPDCQSPQTRKKLSAVASFGSGDSGSSGYASSSCSPRGGFS
jgi:putative FmdB family regulatory protein